MNDERDHEQEHDLDPVQRLRAADPAAAVEPSAGFADEVVARAAADPAAEPVPVADLHSEGARRRPRWIPFAAVAASLVVVGAVGYGVGATTGGASDLAGGAAPPISLQSGTGAGASEQGDAAATERSKMSGAGAADLMYPSGFGRNHFTASGLSTSEATAAGYGFDAGAAASAEGVAALAAALGVQGAPELADGAWTVGAKDGTGPALWVSLDGTLSFSYSDPRINPWKCVDGAETCEPTGDLPSEEAAIDALRSILVAAGRDPAAFEFTSETYEGAVTRQAQAWPVVDGQRIDQAWTLDLASEGVFGAYGALAALIPLGDYPVVSEQEGFERLSDPRFGASMTGMPIALRDQPIDSMEWVPPTEPPAAPTAGTALAWPVNDVEIVGARLGLASQWQPDGSVLVVPAYEFTDADGGVWSVIAVADAKLDLAAG